MCALLPIVLLLPLSLGLSLNLLKEGFISTTGFLIGSVLPPYSIYMCVRKQVSGLQTIQRGDAGEQLCMEHILEMEEELFREDSEGIRWPVVQLYRNFLIVFIDVFMRNPIYKTIGFLPVFVLFLVHDRNRTPFKHPYLNILQVGEKAYSNSNSN